MACRCARPMQERTALLVRNVIPPSLRGLLAVLAVVLGTSLAMARQDVAGGADHPLIVRYDRSVIIAHHTSLFYEFDIATGPHTSSGSLLTSRHTARGPWTRLLYVVPEGHSTLDVMRHYSATLLLLGFETVFSCEGSECGAPQGPFGAGSAIIRNALLPTEDLSRFGEEAGAAFSRADDVRLISARLARPEGALYVSMAMALETSGQFPLTANRVLILLDVVETDELEERMARPAPQPVASAPGAGPQAADFGTFTPPAVSAVPGVPGVPAASAAPAPPDPRPGGSTSLAAQLPQQETIPLALTDDDRVFLAELAEEIDALIAEIEERRIAMRARFAGEDLAGEIERAFAREGVTTREIAFLGHGDLGPAIGQFENRRGGHYRSLFEPTDLLPGVIAAHEEALQGVEEVLYAPYVELLEAARDRLENRAGAIARLINWPDGSPTPLTPAIRAGLRRDMAYLQGGQAIWRGEEQAVVSEILPRFRAQKFHTWARLAMFGRENAAEIRAWLPTEREPDVWIDSDAGRCALSLAFRTPALAFEPRFRPRPPIYMPLMAGVSHLSSPAFQQPYNSEPILEHLVQFDGNYSSGFGLDCVDTEDPEIIRPVLRLAAARYPPEPDPPTLDEFDLGPELAEPQYEPVASIHYGHPVYIEAVFETPPAREAYSVTVETPFGRTGVLVERTGDNPLLYRSGPVVFAHADGRSAERSP